MGMKKAILSLSIIAILTICMFNSVAAAPVNKQTTDVHSNYAMDMRAGQQTYLAICFGVLLPPYSGTTADTIGVGQSITLSGVLASDIPPINPMDDSHGIPGATVHIQSMNSDGQTWTTVATRNTMPEQGFFHTEGVVVVSLTPMAAGVYNYRITYDGDSRYAPAVSNVVTLTVK
ncbi:MAG: Ig-like domain-containing protein [Halobacteriota archaeon]